MKQSIFDKAAEYARANRPGSLDGELATLRAENTRLRSFAEEFRLWEEQAGTLCYPEDGGLRMLDELARKALEGE